MIRIICSILTLFVSFTFIDCKNIRETSLPALKNMPINYGQVGDSLNSANLNWKNYFTDSVLISLIDEGIKNNPDVLIALQKIEAGKANIQYTRGALFPSVSANAGYLHRKFGLYTMDGAGNISTEITPGQIVPVNLPDYYIGMQTSWEVDIWGRLKNKKKAALARYLASVEGKNFVVTNLVSQISNAYYELIALDNELEAIRETISIQERAVEMVTQQKEAAAANALAVMQFKANLLNSRALEYETSQRITEFETRINFLLGRYPQTIVRDKSTFDIKPNIPFSAGLPTDLLSHRPDVRQAELELSAAKADLGAAKRAFYPSLNISGSAGLQAFQPILLLQTPESIAYSLFGNLMAPLINRNALKANFTSANASQMEAFYTYQKTILQSYSEVNIEISRIKNLEKTVDLRTEQVGVLIQSIAISTELFKTNRANYLEVLMTQKNALEIRVELINAKLRLYNASINVYKALGGGWK